MDRLAAAGRIIAPGNTLRYVRKLSDFSYYELNQLWDDVAIRGFDEKKVYVVQTTPEDASMLLKEPKSVSDRGAMRR